MDESEYWRRLEFRIRRELAGLRDDRLRGLSCDGLAPKRYHWAENGTRVTGTAWMLGRRDDAPWHFTLIARGHVRSWDDADWDALLPPDDVTGWLSLDPETKTLRIDPAAAYPDAKTPHPQPDATTSRKEFD